MKKFKCYGINEDTDECTACGKKNLKRVVWLAPLDEDGNEVADPAPYGTDCAARMMKWNYSPKKIVAKLNEMDRQRKEEELEAYIKNLMYGWRKCDNKFMLPVDLIERVFRCEITPTQAFKERNERYPILGYLGGAIRLELAYEMMTSM